MANIGQEDPPQPQRGELARREAAPGTQIELWPEMLQLERERIESHDRRTEVLSQMVAADDAADQRLFEFQLEKMRRDDADRSDRRTFGMRLIWALFGGAVLLVSASLLLIAFGDEGQRTAATYLLAVLLTMGGGYGLIAAVTRGVSRFLRR